MAQRKTYFTLNSCVSYVYLNLRTLLRRHRHCAIVLRARVAGERVTDASRLKHSLLLSDRDGTN